MRAFVIINASSGSDDKQGAAAKICATLEGHGLECEVAEVAAGTDIRKIAADAVKAGADRVIAGGGDGTLRAVAQALAGTGASMGILPAGTLNHFARDLEIPLDLMEAAEVAASGVPVCVDVAEVNGHVVINNSVIGLYPFYRAQRKASSGSFLAGVFKTLWHYPYVKIRLNINGEDLTRRTPFVLIANGEHAMDGFTPWHRDSLTEGGLWIYILRDRRRVALLRLLAKMATGSRLADEEFEVFRSTEAIIETGKRRPKVAIDGEIVRLDAPLRYRSRQGELKVLVPKDSRRVIESLCPVSQPVIQEAG